MYCPPASISFSSEIESNDTVSEAAFVSVVSFASEPTVILPLAKLDQADVIPGLNKGSQTDYAAVFAVLRQRIEQDCAALQNSYNLKQPTIFFLTDGGPYVGNAEQPESIWTPPRGGPSTVGVHA